MNDGSEPRQGRLVCPVCGQAHGLTALRPGHRAHCVRCDTLLGRRNRFGGATALAFALTGLILAIPAATLPLMTVAKWGSERTTTIMTGFSALWREGMHLLAASVLLTGILLPLLLLATLVVTCASRPCRLPSGCVTMLQRAALTVQHWAMPEVYVLAVLVAFFKMGNSITVVVGPGLWCYTAMSIAMLLAWRTVDVDPVLATVPVAEPEEAAA